MTSSKQSIYFVANFSRILKVWVLQVVLEFFNHSRVHVSGDFAPPPRTLYRHPGCLPTLPCARARSTSASDENAYSHTSLFHHQQSSFSSTHISSTLPLSPPPLSALASFSIHRSPPPPLSLGPGHMREGRLGRCSSGKKKRERERGEKRSAAISTGRPSPFASLCQKREGFFTTPSLRILTLCLLSLLSARSVPQYHATSGSARLLLRDHCAICQDIFGNRNSSRFQPYFLPPGCLYR